jgi:hypothetical protein
VVLGGVTGGTSGLTIILIDIGNTLLGELLDAFKGAGAVSGETLVEELGDASSGPAAVIEDVLDATRLILPKRFVVSEGRASMQIPLFWTARGLASAREKEVWRRQT